MTSFKAMGDQLIDDVSTELDPAAMIDEDVQQIALIEVFNKTLLQVYQDFLDFELKLRNQSLSTEELMKDAVKNMQKADNILKDYQQLLMRIFQNSSKNDERISKALRQLRQSVQTSNLTESAEEINGICSSQQYNIQKNKSLKLNLECCKRSISLCHTIISSFSNTLRLKRELLGYSVDSKVMPELRKTTKKIIDYHGRLQDSMMFIENCLHDAANHNIPHDVKHCDFKENFLRQTNEDLGVTGYMSKIFNFLSV